MKAESVVMPKAFEIDRFGEEAHISLFVDPILEEGEDGPYYSYEYYKLTLAYRDGLEKEISENYQQWIDFAKGKVGEPKPETEKEKVLRLEATNEELEGVIEDLIIILIEKGVVF